MRGPSRPGITASSIDAAKLNLLFDDLDARIVIRVGIFRGPGVVIA